MVGAAAAAFSHPEKDAMKGGVTERTQIRRIRITLTSSNVKSLEKGECCLLLMWAPAPPPYLLYIIYPL